MSADRLLFHNSILCAHSSSRSLLPALSTSQPSWAITVATRRVACTRTSAPFTAYAPIRERNCLSQPLRSYTETHLKLRGVAHIRPRGHRTETADKLESALETGACREGLTLQYVSAASSTSNRTQPSPRCLPRSRATPITIDGQKVHTDVPRPTPDPRCKCAHRNWAVGLLGERGRRTCG